ncbi:MAG: hypothetical protein WCY01_07565 [Alkalispirochaeta sp.]|jgi:sorbitol-specific phosphotransferase system component IIBC
MGFWDNVKKALVGEAPEKEEPKQVSKAAEPVGPTGVADQQKVDSSASGKYKSVIVEQGYKGWGGPLTITPKPDRHLIYSVTGGGIHPVAQRIADLTGGTPFDGFKSKAAFEEIACAVIDCGGTARIGVYPMKGIPTIDIYSTTPAGPLAKFITEQNFVSGVKVENIRPVD